MSRVRTSCPGSIFLLATLLPACPASAQQQTITCTSTLTGARTCPADAFYGVLLLRETVPGRCVWNKTWHFTAEAISVSDGCSADFQVHPRRTDPRSKEPYQIHGTGEDAVHTNGNVRPKPEITDPRPGNQPGAPAPKPR